MNETRRGGGLDLGRVLSRTFGAIGVNWASLALLTLGLAVLPQIVTGHILVPRLVAAGADPAGVSFVTVLAESLPSTLLQAATIKRVVTDFDGARASLASVLAVALRCLLPLLGLGIVTGLGEAAGLLALVIPGLMLITRWSLAIPALVVERSSIDLSMSRSADLTRGHRWAVFALLLLNVLFVSLATLLGEAITGAFGHGASDLAIVGDSVEALIQGFVSLIGATGLAALYVELRDLKEGGGRVRVAKVFD